MSQTPLIQYAALDDFRTPTFRRRLGSLLLRWLLWSASALVLFAVFVGAFQLMMVGVLPAVLGVIACTICTSVAAVYWRAARRERAMRVLIYCEQGVRLALPLPDFLHAVAMNETPRLSRRIDAIVRTLEAPASLGSAIGSELPELPGRYADLIRLAEANGTLPETLRRLVRDEPRPSPATDVGGPMPLAYLAIMSVGLIVPAIMVSVFVMPKLFMIYRDFGAPRPAMWAWLVGLDYQILYLIVAGVPVAALALLIGVVARNSGLMYFSRIEYDRPFKPFIDRLRWYTPMLGRQIRDRDWADACQSIADGLAHHRPLDVLAREAASPHLNDVTLARLDRFHSELTAGRAIGDAARAARLPRAVVGLIMASTPDGLAPSFDFLADHYRARALQRGAWLTAMIMPTLTLMCGAAVTAFALFLWIPLCRLIDATLPYPVGM